MIKKCPTCKTDKKISDFYERKPGVPASKCKDCFNKYCIQRWINRKIQAIQMMGGKCFDCNNEYHYSVYDFHHLTDKDVEWTKLRLKSAKQIKEELDKCVLLCSNCHRLRHYASVA